MSVRDRQRQLACLRRLEPVISTWSLRLGRNNAERVGAFRDFLFGLATIHVGMARELSRGSVHDGEIILLVDEYAEAVYSIVRPALPRALERQVRDDMAALLRRNQQVSR